MVFSTPESHLAYLMEQKLKEEGVYVVMMNKQDSSYNNFGEIQLWVQATDVVRAKYILDKSYE